MASRYRPATRAALAGLVAAAAGYAGLVALARIRYGRTSAPTLKQHDAFLDELMPEYDIAERHSIGVAAPAPVTLAAACEIDLQRTGFVRLIFRAREVLLGGTSGTRRLSRGLVDETKALGWGVLKDDPGHEIVMGAVTKPWEADVVFRAVPPDQFRAFDDPGFVKIVWTLRADPLGANASVFRTETRAVATDRAARMQFRRYWSFLSPGIILIRWAMLRPVKVEAERRARAGSRDQA